MGAADASPLVSAWALATAAAKLPKEALRTVLETGLRNRMAFIRADSLRRYAREGFTDVRAKTEAAALDRSQTVRRVADYLLRTDGGEGALPLWRSKFDAGELRDELTSAFAESGTADDLARLHSQLAARRARTRASALRGLHRLGAPDLPQLLAAALRDRSALIVGVAADIYSSSNEFPDVAVLESALDEADTPRLRARLISAARLLTKWEQLRYLLRIHPRVHTTHAALLELELDRWNDRANRRFSEPSDEQRSEIREALATLRRTHPLRVLDSIARQF
jgi:hypothetical protein